MEIQGRDTGYDLPKADPADTPDQPNQQVIGDEDSGSPTTHDYESDPATAAIDDTPLN